MYVNYNHRRLNRSRFKSKKFSSKANHRSRPSTFVLVNKSHELLHPFISKAPHLSLDPSNPINLSSTINMFLLLNRLHNRSSSTSFSRSSAIDDGSSRLSFIAIPICLQSLVRCCVFPLSLLIRVLAFISGPIVIEQWLPHKPAPKRIIKHSLPREALQTPPIPHNLLVTYSKPRALIEVELVRLPVVKIDPQTYEQMSAAGQDQLTRSSPFRHEQEYLSRGHSTDASQSSNQIHWRI